MNNNNDDMKDPSQTATTKSNNNNNKGNNKRGKNGGRSGGGRNGGGGRGGNNNHNNNNNNNRNTGPPSGRKLSHALSWALRHQAINIGLTMTPDGYVPVQEILESNHPRLKGAKLEDIEECVQSNDKQRYRLEYRPKHLYYNNNRMKRPRTNETDNDNGTDNNNNDDNEMILCIRANQGHSISIVNPDLLYNKKLTTEELQAMPCIVHGTYKEPWNIISQQGLNKMTRTHIHFASGLPGRKHNSNEQEVISGMRQSCQIYIYINAEKCAKDGIDFFISDNGVILTAGVDNNGTLPTIYFSHVTDNHGNILLDNRVVVDSGAAAAAAAADTSEK